MDRKKILIIDDDPDVRAGYHIRLSANNFETFFAVDGASSMMEARRNRPDLIILDLGLPGGDGFVVMERLKANPYCAVIPIIVVSGRDKHKSRDQSLKAGACAFLQKPVDTKELLYLIKLILRETPASAR